MDDYETSRTNENKENTKTVELTKEKETPYPKIFFTLHYDIFYIRGTFIWV